MWEPKGYLLLHSLLILTLGEFSSLSSSGSPTPQIPHHLTSEVQGLGTVELATENPGKAGLAQGSVCPHGSQNELEPFH